MDRYHNSRRQRSKQEKLIELSKLCSEEQKELAKNKMTKKQIKKI
jgi:hypothetical protein